jgi:hypothetical protein
MTINDMFKLTPLSERQLDKQQQATIIHEKRMTEAVKISELRRIIKQYNIKRIGRRDG